MEPHSWIIAIAGMAYLYFLSQIFDRRRVYLIKKSRIHQPVSENDKELKRWKIQFDKFQRELKNFRIGAVILFLIIPVLEFLAHAYIGDHLAQIWWIPTLIFLTFAVGFAVLITEMSGPQPLDIKKLDKRSLLFG